MQYARTIEYAYKNRSSYDMLNFIFTASSFNDAIKRATYLKSYHKYRDEQVANINNTQLELTRKIELLKNNKVEKEKVLEQQTAQKSILEGEQKEKNQLLSKLKSREKEIAKEMEAKKRIERSLQNSIAAIVKREIEAARKKAIEDAKSQVTEALKSDDAETINSALGKLTEASMKLGEAVYKQAQAEQSQTESKDGADSNEKVVDAEFEEVKKDDTK